MTGPSNFTQPRDIALGDDYIVVSETNDYVQVFDTSGNYQFILGNGSGSGFDQFNNPEGITMNDTHFLIADSGNNRIQIFYKNGTHAGEWVGFNNPQDISFNGTHFFVVNTDQYVVEVFSEDGTPTSTYIGIDGLQGTEPNLLGSPRKVFFDPFTNYIYVADIGQNHISIFQTDKYTDYGSLQAIGYAGIGTFLMVIWKLLLQ